MPDSQKVIEKFGETKKERKKKKTIIRTYYVSLPIDCLMEISQLNCATILETEISFYGRLCIPEICIVNNNAQKQMHHVNAQPLGRQGCLCSLCTEGNKLQGPYIIQVDNEDLILVSKAEWNTTIQRTYLDSSQKLKLFGY